MAQRDMIYNCLIIVIYNLEYITIYGLGWNNQLCLIIYNKYSHSSQIVINFNRIDSKTYLKHGRIDICNLYPCFWGISNYEVKYPHLLLKIKLSNLSHKIVTPIKVIMTQMVCRGFRCLSDYNIDQMVQITQCGTKQTRPQI